jgi:2-hydroxyglutarate dehydrogenase
VPGLRRLSAEELRELEPHCVGLAALHSPSTGVVDFAAVANALADDLRAADVPVIGGCEVTGVRVRLRDLEVRHAMGDTAARFVVFCAGAWSDVLAERAGAPDDPRIVRFVGRYLYLRPERARLVRSLIYPVPDPSLPFLGVHLTRHVDGRVSLGPTALLQPRLRSLTWPGTWRMARRWWRTGIVELRHALSTRTLASAAARYVPELTPDDFDGGFSGVRAQALARDGSLVDDFVISHTARALHVRNAPSPAATSSLAIARMIADEAEKALG